MNFQDNILTIRMSSNNDSIEVRPHSSSDHPNSFKRARTIEPPPNRGTSGIFFKTRMCAKFRFGTCRNGENCNFAHGVEDTRKPPPNWQELVGPRNQERLQLENWEEESKIIQKMKLCKKYCNGEECPYGEKCNFLHEDPAKFRDDSWNSRESYAIRIGTIGSPKSFVNKTARDTNWKTKLCLKWQHTRCCPFREECHFAHGEPELRVSGGGIESEAAVAIANSTKAIIPTLPEVVTGSSNDAHNTLRASLLVEKEDEQAKKNRFLSLKLNRINGIYGDWIDYMET